MKIFKTNYIEFKRRIWNQSKIYLFAVIFFILIILYKEVYYFFYIIGFYLIAGSILFLRNAKENIYKVVFEDMQIIFFGATYDNMWQKNVLIYNSKIKIKTISSRNKNNVKYYLVIKTNEDEFTINFFQEYTDIELLEIFNTYKEYKNEKIIWDERFVLDNLKEKINNVNKE